MFSFNSIFDIALSENLSVCAVYPHNTREIKVAVLSWIFSFKIHYEIILEKTR